MGRDLVGGCIVILNKALEALPDVHPSYGQIPMATVVGNDSLTEAQLHQWCRQHLSGHKVPRRFRFTDALPRTSRGKLDRKHPSLQGAE